MPGGIIMVPSGGGGSAPTNIDLSVTNVEPITEHVQRALDRRCQQFRFASDDEEDE